jgi:hypothetical protein
MALPEYLQWVKPLNSTTFTQENAMQRRKKADHHTLILRSEVYKLIEAKRLKRALAAAKYRLKRELQQPAQENCS